MYHISLQLTAEPYPDFAGKSTDGMQAARLNDLNALGVLTPGLPLMQIQKCPIHRCFSGKTASPFRLLTGLGTCLDLKT
jgi:hypothetical protein